MNATKRIFGIPMKYKDIVHSFIHLHTKDDLIGSYYVEKPMDLEMTYRLQVHLRTDFIEEIFKEVYFSVSDITAKLGGIGASA